MAKVDKLITSVTGEWKFSKEVVANFDSHVKKSVPFYSEVQNMVLELSEWFIKDNTKVYDLGCSTGESINLLQKKHKRKINVQYVGIDKSQDMLDKAKIKCDRSANFLLGNIESKKITNANLVLSLYTLQFVPVDRREKIIKQIYDGLKVGGALIIVEKLRAEKAIIEDIWRELYWDFKRKQGLTEKMIIQKSKSLRGVLVPLSLDGNIKLLKNAGFSTIDIFFKWNNFAGIIAIKTKKKKKSLIKKWMGAK